MQVVNNSINTRLKSSKFNNMPNVFVKLSYFSTNVTVKGRLALLRASLVKYEFPVSHNSKVVTMVTDLSNQ